MGRKVFLAVLALLCLASAGLTVRSLHHLDYGFYTTSANQSIGFVLAEGLVQLDLIDNGDVHPRVKGPWDGGSVNLAQPGWERRFESSCAPAAVHFIAPNKRLAYFIPFDCGSFVGATDPSDPFSATISRTVVRLVVFPGWVVVVITGAVPLLLLTKKAWRKLTTRPTQCKWCGYDLRATPLRCPECGRTTGAFDYSN